MHVIVGKLAAMYVCSSACISNSRYDRIHGPETVIMSRGVGESNMGKSIAACMLCQKRCFFGRSNLITQHVVTCVSVREYMVCT